MAPLSHEEPRTGPNGALAEPSSRLANAGGPAFSASLKAVAGPTSGQIWQLSAAPLVLGRHPDCQVPVNVPDASRHHARLDLVEGQWFLEDLLSRNGTFLNSQPVKHRRRLKHGDQIRIGEVVLRFYAQQILEPSSSGEKPRSASERAPESSRHASVSSRLPASVDPSICRVGGNLPLQLKTILEISRSLRGAITLNEVLPQILNHLLNVFNTADRALAILRGDDGRVVPHWVRVRGSNVDQEEADVPISHTVIEQAMRSQEAVISEDATGDDRFKAAGSIHAVQIHSIMCAPLVDAAGKSFGVLQVDSLRGQQKFNPEELELFVGIAAQASIAIDNARLHEQQMQHRALERDLELAEQIQRSFLPHQPPDVPGYQFYHYYQPAQRIGGDYYDFVPLCDGRMGIIIADVVGHGLAAAMWTAKLAAEIRYHLLAVSSPDKAITRLNQVLAHDLATDHYVTLAVAVLDPKKHTAILVNAGHPPPLLWLPGGRTRDLVSEGAHMPLGVGENTQYDQTKVDLPPGALLVLFTDGMTKALNASEEEYGRDRLQQHLASLKGGPEAVGPPLVEAVRRFVGRAAQADDVCLICAGRTGRG